jgi:alkylhydroperoxidase family enzyme
MARIPLLDENDPTLAPETRAGLEEARLARGRLLNLHRALAHRPEASKAVMTLVQTVYRQGSTLQPRHGELAYMTATAVNDCFY